VRGRTFIGLCGMVFLFLPEVKSQGHVSLKGIIVSGDKPVSYASVTIDKTTVASDSVGAFVVHGLITGERTVRVTAAGFKPYSSKLFAAEGENTLRIELESEAQVLEDLVVTGTLRAVTRSESPVAVEIYTPQFFKKNPAPSIFEALQNVNGVRPQLNCNVCNTGDIHINGLEGPYTMITIDGMPIVSSLASVYGLFGIPTQMIERVEIVKGPASGLYGSEAVGGLINIITKSPEKAPLFTADVMSTSWQEHKIDAGVKFNIGRKAVNLIGVNYFNYQNPVDNNNDNFTDVTLQHRISVFNKLGFVRRESRVATLAARYFYEDRWGGEMQWSKHLRGGDSVYGESIYTKRLELIGNYQLPVREKMFIAFSATAHDQDSYYGKTAYQGDQKIVFGQLLWDKSFFQKHNSLLGLAGRYNYYDDNSTATFDIIKNKNRPDQYFIPGIFVQDEWRLNENHLLLTGLRYDHHPAHGSIVTPRIAYKWSVSNKQVFRLNAGTGFRVVNLFTEEHAALTGAREVEVADELKPERSYNVNVNYTNRWHVKKHSFLLDASVWYSYFNNQIIPDYLTDPDKIIYKNLDGYSSTKGITINAEWNIGNRLKTMLGTTLQDVAKFEKDQNGKMNKQELVLTEKWNGTWGITYFLPAVGLTIDYTGNMYGPMQLPLLSSTDPRPATSPVWSLQNIQFTKRFKEKWEIYAGIKNLLNWTPAKAAPFLIARANDPFDKHVQYDTNGQVLSTPDNPYGLTFDPTYVYAPNQGIRAFLGVRIQVK
jgi:outer membrane receptor for ferrienterochelin and colicins